MKLMLAARDEFPEGIGRPAPKFIELVALFSPLRFNLFGSFLNCPGGLWMDCCYCFSPGLNRKSEPSRGA